MGTNTQLTTMELTPRPNGSALCRDCFETSAEQDRRCQNCGGPRLVQNPELFQLSIAHIDCDAFYAAIEKRDNPEIADQPVIIGGGKRGVVSTACYQARIYGVHSAMPMFKALKACPDAIVIRPDMAKYVAAAKQVRARMQELTPLVQPISIDEAFLDLSGTERLHGAPPAVSLARLAKRIESEVGITVSVGLSHNKFLAKIASDLEKPRGFCVVGRAQTREFLASLPSSAIWGVGRSFQKRLARDGLTRIAQLQRTPERDLVARYGAMGLRLARLSRGLDDRSVNPKSSAKSLSAETTFNNDRSTLSQLLPVLRRLSEKVAWRLKEKDLAGQTVVLKLKTTDFAIRTRNRKLFEATQLADRIFRIGRELLEAELDGTRYRLIGIGVSGLVSNIGADPVDLLDPAANQRARAENAMDDIRRRYGESRVEMGLTFSRRKVQS